MPPQSTPPHPGNAGNIGSRALEGAVVTGVMIPIVQYMLWVMMVDLPSTTEVLSQPPNTWLFLGVLGILPPLFFLLGVAGATNDAGAAGGFVYVLMWIAGQYLLGQPVLAVMTIVGLSMGLFLYLVLKWVKHNRNRGRGSLGRSR